MRDEDFLFGENHASDAEGKCRHGLAVEFTDILVAVGTENIVAILMKAHIERSAMLDHRLVEARKEHVGLIVHFRNGDHEQTVLLAGVAASYGGAMVSPRLVGAEHFFGKRLLQVDHKGLVKFKITHDLWFRFFLFSCFFRSDTVICFWKH